jgi:GNAT superfamily N-acetyltransferase
MRIEQADPSDPRKARECHEVYLAAQRVDEPGGPWFTDRAFGGWLAVGGYGSPRELWLATEDASVTGWYELVLPDRENHDRASLDLTVHPAARRRGLGLALLRHAAGRAAETVAGCSTAARATAPPARRLRSRPGRKLT